MKHNTFKIFKIKKATCLVKLISTEKRNILIIFCNIEKEKCIEIGK